MTGIVGKTCQFMQDSFSDKILIAFLITYLCMLVTRSGSYSIQVFVVTYVVIANGHFSNYSRLNNESGFPLKTIC